MEIKKNAEIIVYEDIEEFTDNKSLHIFSKLCKILESKDIYIKRYSFREDREQFRKNKDLWYSICYVGREILPVTYVNDKIKKIEEYPTKKDIYSWLADAK